MRKSKILLLLMLLIGVASADDAEFNRLGSRFLEGYLRLSPETATVLGDHRYDARWTDYSPQGIAEAERFYQTALDDAKKIDPGGLSEVNRIDREILIGNVEGILFGLRELKEYRWNPLVYNPGSALYPLMARDFAPLSERLASLGGRLDGVPALLRQAKANLQSPPKIHTETAILQNKGAISLIQKDLDTFVAQVPGAAEKLAGPRKRAVEALQEYGRWLEQDLLPRSTGDFRLGKALWTKKLGYTLESDLSPEEILARAQRELELTQKEMETVARKLYRGNPEGLSRKAVCKAVLDELAKQHPNNQTIVRQAAEDLARATQFVRAKNIVTVTDDECKVIEMPEFARGVSIAYCDSPGPLEKKGETFYAIAPTPADWTPQRVESFFREYNDYMLENLTVHEAMPGHFLQLMHANRFQAPTRLRAVFQSGTFVEGWATYAEQVMAAHGYGGPEVKMQQLKMRLRLILNSILDQKVHTAQMTEPEAIRLMTEEGFQEEGEAAGKWRRACLTSTQLSTYFVGNSEVNDLVKDYRAAHPQAAEREVHDRVLSFGSPAPRYIRRLLGLAPKPAK